MVIRAYLFLILLGIGLVGCGGSSEVRVQILPNSYVFGEVRSTLATPIVEEVAKKNPKKVHIETCTSTPPRKIVQFRDELAAKSGAEITLSFIEHGCSS